MKILRVTFHQNITLNHNRELLDFPVICFNDSILSELGYYQNSYNLIKNEYVQVSNGVDSLFIYVLTEDKKQCRLDIHFN